MKRTTLAVFSTIMAIICLVPATSCQKEAKEEEEVYTGTEVTILPGDTVQQVSGLMIIMDTDDLINQADTIVTGKVVEICEPKWSNEYPPPQTIYMDVIIEPETFLLGLEADKIAVRVLGGRIGTTCIAVEDQSEFTLGEEMLLFLSRPVDLNLAVPENIGFTDYYKVTGALQGKWSYSKGTAVSYWGTASDISTLETRIAELRHGSQQSGEFERPSHEGTPLVSMVRTYLLGGKASLLSIFEDGTVILTEDLHLRLPVAPVVPVRYWFTGKLSEDRLSKLMESIQTSGFAELEEHYVSEGYAIADLGITFKTNMDGITKTVTSMGYFENDLPDVLEEIYENLIAVTYNLKLVGSEEII